MQKTKKMIHQCYPDIQDITDKTLELIKPMLSQYFVSAFDVKMLEENGVVTGNRYLTSIQNQYALLENITEVIENQSK